MEPQLPPQTPPQPAQTPIGKTKPRWIKYVILVAVVATASILAVVLLTQGKNTSKQAPQTAAEKRTVTVQITKDGFVPTSLQIPAGTQVNWVNDDATAHHIVSDPYPTSNVISDLDGKEALVKGDSLSYVFTKSGSYTYHDSTNPTLFKGTVIVQ